VEVLAEPLELRRGLLDALSSGVLGRFEAVVTAVFLLLEEEGARGTSSENAM
ncbi:hypothetical protein A2U01_0119257, partial [Trifolium medium]|nr:hypothetical protein [Trifolium medium]